MIYNTKIIKSKNHIEISKYEKPIITGYKNSIIKNSREKTPDIIKENKDRSIRRAKSKVSRIVNTNYNSNSSFLTLTFKEEVRDLKWANYKWKLFREKIERCYNVKLKYCGIIEYQDGTKEYSDKQGNKHKGTGRNSIHFHIVLFDPPYLDFNILSPIWKQYSEGGSIHIEPINDIDNIAAYLVGHIGKGDDDLFKENKGKKRYLNSKNLDKCIELKYNTNNTLGKHELEKIMHELENVKPSYQYTSQIKKYLPDENNILRLCVVQERDYKAYNLTT